ncbi:N-acetyltransferase [Anaerocolumna cellulosilytica]|uniref:N-acetyltransferase n=1 Tax=Anaerocolumna cellulosilytica TaxID=433286 RepID=A0A6S6R4N5_9FIRM|nr:GNAT family N-acetyltransferase [Anaerocolumna cellulosilytica]MBB5197220.1 ribosomal protein S18 acetylase RimI-like enzyme [Anaerocolumna cellulosilytica]BCJ94028.1 N-acetyltransferase [Anaerocolumna cellulosilytica]
MEVSIVKGNPMSEAGARLNQMALDYMAYSLIGSKDGNMIERTLRSLWKQKENRFSHEYAFEAKLMGDTVGMVTCYSVTVMNELAWPTTRRLLKLRRWELVKYALLHLNEIIAMLALKEGRDGEYHIGTLATLPESRGYGIGSKLIAHVEAYAIQHGFQRISLTVKKDNEKARKLYEKLGYQIVGSINKKPFFLYRMAKKLC